MTVVVVFEEDVLRLICGYAAQNGGSFEKSSLFMINLKVNEIHTIQLI